MKILNVAEKPAMAKTIANILSNGQCQRRQGLNKYCAVLDFDYRLDGEFYQMSMTSVLGHVTNMDFPESYGNWYGVEPSELFTADLKKDCVDSSNKSVLANIEREARSSFMLIIWTDCDREGEAIGSNIAKLCLKVKSNIQVKRARFSAITARELHYAMNHLMLLDENQAKAVETRQELDLRTGAALTRFLTINFKQRLSEVMKDKLISYGSCQFPTLGFVVEQYLKIQNFKAEEFWKIQLNVKKEKMIVDFSWHRGSIFDPLLATIIYERLVNNPEAIIKTVNTSPTSQRKPYPLTTIALQKFVSNVFKISSHDLMKIAESLYNKGYISYPRTETDQFPPSFDFQGLIRQQSGNPAWGQFATQLLNDESKYSLPRKGKNNDQAHPPIHPTKPGLDLSGNDARVYEFITRRFLAGCSKDAEGLNTEIKLEIFGELFYATGTTVLALNYMEVYPYDKWVSNAVPRFSEGERVQIDSLLLTSGKTCSGSLLSEADLISTMDKNGIGTDATIHDHIQTILNRGYVLRRPKDRRFEPSPLGIALIKGFDAIPLGNNVCLSKPELRKKMEHDMKEICLGQKQPRLVLEQNIRLFIFIYNKLKENMHILENAFSNLVTAVPASSSRQGQTVNRFTNTSHRDDDPSDSENDKFNAHNGRKSYYSNIPRKRIGGLFETPNSTTIEEPIRCDCGLEAKVSVAKTGENDGREYATCVKSGARCKFWLWLDGQPSKKPATTHSKGPSTTSHTRTYKSKKF